MLTSEACSHVKLTAKTVAAARYVDRNLSLADGGGLVLAVTRTARTWRYRYRLAGVARQYTIGSADEISLAEARDLHREARRRVQAGADPVSARREKRAAAVVDRTRAAAASLTVRALFDEWVAHHPEWAESHRSKVLCRHRVNLPPAFLDTPVVAVTPAAVMAVLGAIEDRGTLDAAHRVRGDLANVFDRAVRRDVIGANPVRHPAVELKKKPAQVRYGHVTEPQVLADILLAIDGYVGLRSVNAALRLLPLTFVRPGELRGMVWAEVDLEGATWTIPAARMKARNDHLVPLSRQAVAILEEQRRWTGDGPLAFPGAVSRTKAISNNTLNLALRRLGFEKDVITSHGFRHTASTMLNESVELDGVRHRFEADWIEAQLAHKRPGVRGVYNRAQYLDDRRRMMQVWADYLDRLRATGRRPESSHFDPLAATSATATSTLDVDVEGPASTSR